MANEDPEYTALKPGSDVAPEDDQDELEKGLTSSKPQLRRSQAGLAHYWIVNPYTWWRHPPARLSVPIFIMALDFFIYAEDPVNDSRVEYSFPILGHWYGLLCLWPSKAGLILLRVVIILVCFILGMYTGRQWVHHRFLRDRLGLTMFEENKGTMIIMVIVVFVYLYIGALVYNFSLGGDTESPISSNTHLEFYKWGKVFQIFSVFLDIVSIIMISDNVLQDKSFYPDWGLRVKHLWNDACGGWVRVIVSWLVFVALVSATTSGILSTGHHEGDITWQDSKVFGGLSEVWRTILLTLCVFCDLLAVAQDWEFPTFRTSVEVKIAGTFQNELNFDFLSKFVSYLCWPFPSWCCTKLPSCCCTREEIIEFFHFKMTGPWLTYLPLCLAVLFGDLSCAKNQFMYRPENYGQYVDPGTKRIWAILDKEYLSQAYTEGILTNSSLIRYDARRDASGEPLNDSAKTDVLLSSRYLHTEWFTSFGPVTDAELYMFLAGVFIAVGFCMLVGGGQRVVRSKAVELLGQIAS